MFLECLLVIFYTVIYRNRGVFVVVVVVTFFLSPKLTLLAPWKISLQRRTRTHSRPPVKGAGEANTQFKRVLCKERLLHTTILQKKT